MKSKIIMLAVAMFSQVAAAGTLNYQHLAAVETAALTYKPAFESRVGFELENYKFSNRQIIELGSMQGGVTGGSVATYLVVETFVPENPGNINSYKNLFIKVSVENLRSPVPEGSQGIKFKTTAKLVELKNADYPVIRF